MASSYSNLLRLEKMANGEKDDTWGTTLNTQIEMVEDGLAGRADITLAASEYTLSTANGATDEARMMLLDMSGTITANIDVIVPTSSKFYIAKNGTSGSFTVTVKTTGGSGIVVEQGKTLLLYCDGTNVEEVSANPPGAVALATSATLAEDSTLFDGDAKALFALLAGNQSFTKAQAVTSVDLSNDASNIAVDATLTNYFRTTLDQTTLELDNPTGMKDGQALVFRVLQDGTGGRLLTYGTKYKFPGGTAPTLSTGISAVDIITGIYDSTADEIACSFNLNSS